MKVKHARTHTLCQLSNRIGQARKRLHASRTDADGGQTDLLSEQGTNNDKSKKERNDKEIKDCEREQHYRADLGLH